MKKQKTFKIKARLTLPDGFLGGTLKIKAPTQEIAEHMARLQLATTFGSVKVLNIEVLK